MTGFRAARKLLLDLSTIRDEDEALRRFLASLEAGPGARILDVGCGRGDKMRLMAAEGYAVTGVDINAELVRENVGAGLDCRTVEEFDGDPSEFDVVLMSHIIEHFHPDDLVEFMDTYLDRLSFGGHLIIATPLPSPYFYEDFDHVKPYYPSGINAVFCERNAQVKQSSQHRLAPREIWFRRGPHRVVFAAGFFKGRGGKLPSLVNASLAGLFRLSRRRFGRKDGWMGLYEKVG